MSEEQKLGRIWFQNEIPVVLRRKEKGQKIRLRLPSTKQEKRSEVRIRLRRNKDAAWLRDNRRNRPEWNSEQKFWEIPKAWFNDFVERALDKYGVLYIIQPYREQEKCASACMNAVGHECECSCMGANHGAGNDGSWFEVSETFATRWHSQELACRLMKRSR